MGAPTQKSNFLVCWNAFGLDSIYNVSSIEKEASWAKLKGERFVWPYNVSMLKLRAHSNRHQNYEIYIFESDKSLDELTDWFKTDPQPLVESIRKTGECLYSDHSPLELRKIR